MSKFAVSIATTRYLDNGVEKSETWIADPVDILIHSALVGEEGEDVRELIFENFTLLIGRKTHNADILAGIAALRATEGYEIVSMTDTSAYLKRLDNSANQG